MRAVAEALREPLKVKQAPAPVLMNVGPEQAFPYTWLPTRVTTIQGRHGEYLSTFGIYYRAKGREAVEALASKADFVDGLKIGSFGGARFLCYVRNSRTGPDEDPNDPTINLITDTLSCSYYQASQLADANPLA